MTLNSKVASSTVKLAGREGAAARDQVEASLHIGKFGDLPHAEAAGEEHGAGDVGGGCMVGAGNGGEGEGRNQGGQNSPVEGVAEKAGGGGGVSLYGYVCARVRPNPHASRCAPMD